MTDGIGKTVSDAESDSPNSGKKRPVAVALGHEPEDDRLPKVIASGRGAVAEQILQIAFANDIKVREDAELAEILGVLDVDSEIPLEAFAAVAEILAYVYRLNGGAGPSPEIATTNGNPTNG